MNQGVTTGTASVQDRCINAIRVLAMAAVQRAESGHSGTPMGLAPLAYVLWTRHLRYNPADPAWMEYGHTPGVEATTGPLGQGVGNAVGMAIAEAHLAALFNRNGHAVIDHY